MQRLNPLVHSNCRSLESALMVSLADEHLDNEPNLVLI